MHDPTIENIENRLSAVEDQIMTLEERTDETRYMIRSYADYGFFMRALLLATSFFISAMMFVTAMTIAFWFVSVFRSLIV